MASLIALLVLTLLPKIEVVAEDFERFPAGVAASLAEPSQFSQTETHSSGSFAQGTATANVASSIVLQHRNQSGTMSTQITGYNIIGDRQLQFDFLVASGTHNLFLRDRNGSKDAVLIKFLEAGTGAPGQYFIQVQGETGSSPAVFESLVNYGEWIRGTIQVRGINPQNPKQGSFSVSFENLTSGASIGSGTSHGWYTGSGGTVAQINQFQFESPVAGELQVDNILIHPESVNIAKAAFGAIPIASSQSFDSSVQVENLIDGNPETYWSSNFNTFPHWVELRFPQPAFIEKMIVKESVASQAGSYRIDVFSAETNSWRTVAGPKANSLRDDPIIEPINATEITKIRYYALTPQGDATRSEIHSIQVYGHAPWIQAAQSGLPPYLPDAGTFPAPKTRAHYSLSSFEIDPGVAKPGRKMQIRMQLRKTVADDQNYGFQVRIGKEGLRDAYGKSDYTLAVTGVQPAIPTSHWVVGKDYEVTANITIPAWSPHDASVPIIVTPLRASGAVAHAQSASSGSIVNVTENVVGTLKIQRFDSDPTPWPAVVPTTQIKIENDQANIYVNGKYISPYIMTVPDNASAQSIGEQLISGSHLWRVLTIKDVAADYSTPEGDAENARYFAAVDEEIHQLLKYDPDAWVIVAFSMRPTEWSLHWPDETTILSDGSKKSYSLSSPRWARQLDYDYRALVRHLMSQDYSGHVIGVHYETAKETQYWGWENSSNNLSTAREDIVFGDFSPVHIAAFRKWLRHRYVNEQALQQAWNDSRVTFANAFPTPAVLRQMDSRLMFKDPAVTRMPMDYWEFHGEAMAQMASVAAKAVKEASGGKYITGLWGFYSNGTFATGLAPGNLQHVGYTGLQTAMASPYIDYFGMIQAYTHRRSGRPMIPESLPQSMLRHGKMPLIEFDARTFFVPVEVASNTFSEQESLSTLYTYAWGAGLRGCALWWVGFPKGATGSDRLSVPWFSLESINAALSKARKWYDAIRATASPSTSEVAVFFNNADVWGMDPYDGRNVLVSAQYQTTFFELMKLGAPVDQYELNDISLPGMSQYKVYVFLNAHHLTTAQRNIIKTVVRLPGKTAVFVYGSGYSDGTNMSVANIQDLTGIVTEVTLEKRLPTVSITSRHPLTTNIPEGYTLKPHHWEHDTSPYVIGPIFNVNDPDAETLGTYTHNNQVAYAAKMISGSRSVYMAIPYLSATVLRDVCRAAGVFIYSQEDIYLDADKHFVLLANDSTHTLNTQIQLPQSSQIYDLWSDTIIGTGNSFTASVPANDSRMYFYGSSSEVASFRKKIRETLPIPARSILIDP